MSNRLPPRRWRAARAAGLITPTLRRAAALPTRLTTASADVWIFVFGDGQRLVTEMTPDGPNSLTMRCASGDVVDQLSTRIGTTEITAWHLPDRLGSFRNLGDASAAVLHTAVYDSSGNCVSDVAPHDGGERFPDDPNLARFVVRPWDANTALQHHRTRGCVPMRGAWITDDGPREVTDADLRRRPGLLS